MSGGNLQHLKRAMTWNVLRHMSIIWDIDTAYIDLG